MKNLKIALIALVTLGTVSLSQAQTKIAHINTRALLTAMPSYQSAMSQLDKVKSSYQAKIQDMFKELQQKSDKYTAEAKDQTDAENQSRQKELQDAQQRIMDFQKNAEKTFQQKQKELLQPIMEKARNAIEKVAKADGYDYVLNTTPGGSVLVANGHDLMNEVKKELGITD